MTNVWSWDVGLVPKADAKVEHNQCQIFTKQIQNSSADLKSIDSVVKKKPRAVG